MSNKPPTYIAQARLNFEIDHLLNMGITRAYVTPFSKNNDCFKESDIILDNLDQLKEKADLAESKGLEIYPLFITIGHPEGNFEIPQRYRVQRNLDGSLRPGFVCFRDEVRQNELLQFVQKAANLGFQRIAFDDDLRDAFCYCDEHIYGFEPFDGKSRQQIANLLNGVLTSPEHEQLRIQWYKYKRSGMEEFAKQIETSVHTIKPDCRIGIFNSAKRSYDYSGRIPSQWAELFHTQQAPVFIRLCGECYDDQIKHLVQSTGWHSYFDRCYPDDLERMLEITSVPSIGYRSPGTVLFECETVAASTRHSSVLWAWTEEFAHTGLDGLIASSAKRRSCGNNTQPCEPKSPMAVYIDHNLGPYTPTDISTAYGQKQDPLTAYNITALLGLPVVATPVIGPEHKLIICSSYISRRMIENIDTFTHSGGTCVLDAIAAKCYLSYGGKVEFAIDGPRSLHSYEINTDGQRDDIIADCPCDAIYQITSGPETQAWTGYDIDGNVTGTTVALIPFGKGAIIVMGYDFDCASMALLRPGWRQRLLDSFSITGDNIPAYWSGPVAVQVICYQTEVVVVNYNSHTVTGKIVTENREIENLSIPPLSLKRVDISED